MDYAGAMRLFECARNLDRDVENFRNLEVLSGGLAAQRGAVDEFSRDVMPAIVNSDFVNLPARNGASDLDSW